MKILLKNWFYILLVVSITALTTALIAEYFFKLFPCEMCLKQRYVYYIIILLSVLFFIFKKKNSIWFFILTEFAIIHGLFYSIWHVGIEQNLILGPSSCSGNLLSTVSIKELKNQIINQPIINCSEIVWTIFSFSAATINSILLLLILIFNSIYIFIQYDFKKK